MKVTAGLLGLNNLIDYPCLVLAKISDSMKLSRKTIVSILLLMILISCSDDSDTIDAVASPTPTSGYAQYGEPVDNVPETEDIVMYEVNLRAFSQGGDLQGVIDRLDHIESLGINTIWLMPIFPQGELRSVGSPYAVRDYKAVSTEYGNLQDLRELTDAAHSRGMTVILDWVANHTAWDNPWIENKSWYTQNASGSIIHPPGTNWQDVADLNFDNQEMRAAMIDAMRYWVLEANVDGFRCDYADGVPADFWTEAWNEMRSIPNRDLILFAEGNRDDHFDAGFDLSFGWEFYGSVKEVYENNQPADALYNAAAAEYTGVPDGKHFVRFTTNHDESAWDATPVTVFGGVDGALSASVATIFHDGVPLIYSSQEVGQSANVPFFSNSTINWSQNPDMLQQYQQILQFYSSNQAARTGSIQTYSHPDVIHFTKTLNGDEVMILQIPETLL